MNIPASVSADFSIAGRRIGPDHPPYIIAEISANHCQDLSLAQKLVRDCAAAGIDAVKLQTYSAETITLSSDRDEYRIQGGTWDGERLYALYERAMTPWEWTHDLHQLATECGVHLFSTPFDPTAVDFLETCKVPAYKVASFELTYHQLLARVAATGKPVIMSTGLASSEEIQEALGVLRENGAKDIALLKCTSSYPALPQDLNLTLIPKMAQEFKVPIGYSDHTLGATAAIAAVALGACIVEKHVKDSSSSNSADESFSTLTEDLTSLVEECRNAFVARGVPEYGPTQAEQLSLHFRRSIVVVRDIAQGEILRESDLKIVRPMIGAEPKELDLIVGRPAPRSLSRGEGVPSIHEW